MITQKGAAHLVARQRAALVFKGFYRRLKAGTGALGIAPGQRHLALAAEAAHPHGPLLPGVGPGQGGIKRRAGLVQAPCRQPGLGLQHLGPAQAVGLPRLGKAQHCLPGPAQGRVGLVVGQRQFSPHQGDGGGARRIGLRREQIGRRRQRLRRCRQRQQRLGPAALGQGPGLLDRQGQSAEAGHRRIKLRQGLGQQAQFKVGVAHLLFGDGQVLRQGQGLVAAARRIQPRQRRAVLAPRQIEQRDRLVHQGKLQGQALVAGTHAGPGIDAPGLVEIALGGEAVGQTDVSQHRVDRVAQPGKQHAGLAVVAGRLGIGVAAHLQHAQVLDHPGGCAPVAQRQQITAGGLGTRRGVGMAAQH